MAQAPPLLELGPQAQALSCLFLFQVQLNEGTETSLFHLHIRFNGTAAPPGAPILNDRQTKKRSMSELIKRKRRYKNAGDLVSWGKEESAEKSRR